MFLFVFIAFGFCGSLAQNGPIIETIYGPIIGSYQETDAGLPYEEYLGVRFGAPPIGDLRWQKPQPPEPWTDVRNATEFSPHCVHLVALAYPLIGMPAEMSEDCLFLNVFVPGENRVGDDLAVMVFAYGGAWLIGTSTMYPGQDLATFGDVIVVTVNYRVGPIGFLSTEDDAAPGNYGLWDVQMALQWVQDNIAAFGGDVNRVTLFGQSAGGAVASHLMVSPAAEGLFHRGIAISGASASFYGIALEGNVAESTQRLARVVGCRRMNSSEELVDCLREIDPLELDFWGLVSVVVLRRQLPNFIPVIDGDFIPQYPGDSWSEGVASNYDLLSGYAFHDGAMFVTLNMGLPFETINFASSKELLDTFFTFVTNHFSDGESGKELIYEAYPLLDDNSTDIRTRAATDVTTAWWFGSASHFEIGEHSRTKESGRSTYHYRFRYDQSFLEYPEEWITGAHLDDVYSVLGENFMEVMRERFMRGDGQFNDTDRLVSSHVMSYYTNFAKTGNPNDGQTVPVDWPEYDDVYNLYLDISDEPEVLAETEERIEEYGFWLEDFLSVANPYAGFDENDTPFMDDEEISQVIEDVLPTIREMMCNIVHNSFEGCSYLNEQIDLYNRRRLERIRKN